MSSFASSHSCGSNVRPTWIMSSGLRGCSHSPGNSRRAECTECLKALVTAKNCRWKAMLYSVHWWSVSIIMCHAFTSNVPQSELMNCWNTCIRNKVVIAHNRKRFLLNSNVIHHTIQVQIINQFLTWFWYVCLLRLTYFSTNTYYFSL